MYRIVITIARGNRCSHLGDPNWRAEELPTFQLGTACPQVDSQLQGFDTFAEAETPDSATGSNSAKCEKEGGNGGMTDRSLRRGRGERGPRTGARGGGEGAAETAPVVPVVTRSGRTVRPPPRLQV